MTRFTFIGVLTLLGSTLWISIGENCLATDEFAESEACDDAMFLRRVSLDLIGRIPTLAEQSAFEINGDRTGLVNQLLKSNEHAVYWSQLWTTLLLGSGEQQYADREAIRAWIEGAIGQNVAVDKIVFQLISATGTSALDGPVNYILANRDDQVLRLGRAFLGVQLDCAKCHDHPTDRWTNDDYLALERFFKPLRFREVSGGIVVSDDAIGRNTDPKPRFLTGREPLTDAWRRELALMVTQSKPFSRSIAHRIWHWTMGSGSTQSGLSGPVDSIQRTESERFQLLDRLAGELREHGFDAKHLIRTICLSNAYQAEAIDNESRHTVLSMESPPRGVRPLLPEQWIASVGIVVGADPLQPSELVQRTQALIGRQQSSLGSDPYDWEATSQSTLRELSVPLEPRVSDLRELFQSVLGRQPSAEELALVESYSNADALFALIHGNEFLTNH